MYIPTMELFLEEIASRYPNQYILLIMDGAPCHRSQELNIPDNIQIARIPSYSPECNPCENIFDEMREKFFPNLVFDSMDAVEDRMVFALNSLENSPQTIKSIIGWDWILTNV